MTDRLTPGSPIGPVTVTDQMPAELLLATLALRFAVRPGLWPGFVRFAGGEHAYLGELLGGSGPDALTAAAEDLDRLTDSVIGLFRDRGVAPFGTSGGSS